MSIFVLSASTHPTFQRELQIDEWKDYYKQDPDRLRNLEYNMKLNKKGTVLKIRLKGDKDRHKTKKRKEKNKQRNGTFEISTEETSDYLSKLRDKSVADLLSNLSNTSDDSLITGLPGNTHIRVYFLDIMDYCLVTYFSIEFLIRFIFCPVKSRFFKSILNIIDIIALSSEGMIMLFEYLFPKERYTDFSLLDIVECIQIARVFRLFRLIKNFIGFRVLVYSIKASFANMMLMVFLLIVAALVFSTIVFYVNREQFPSIPDAVWWAVVTMTTVGYGDMHPSNVMGKLIGCICAVSGVFVLSVLIPVLVTNFLLFIGFARISGANKKHGLALMVKKEFENLEFKNKGKIRITQSNPS